MRKRDALSDSAPTSRSLKQKTVEYLRDHAVFEVPDPDGGVARSMAPHEREREWEIETLRLFKHRTILVTAASMALLPLFWLLFSYFAPAARWQIGMAHTQMFVCCGVLSFTARRINNLRTLRLVATCAYIIYGMTASAVMLIAHNLNIIILSGHEHILLTLLFVPFALPEAAFCAFLVVGTYALGLWLALSDQLSYTLSAHILSLFFLATLIVLMNHLQFLVRRRAFDLAFDMALSASRGAVLSNLDVVTGGFNRRHLFNMLELELSRAARFEQSLGVIMFDLDDFKIVNDTNGHLAGDEVLRTVLEATTATLRGIDTVARYGGDEFVIVLPNTDADAARQTAERVRERVAVALKERFAPNSLESRVTLSLGAVSLDGSQNKSIEDIIEYADAQLYRAKREGKDRVCMG